MTKFGHSLRTVTVTSCLLSSSAVAQTGLSVINDTVANPDGTMFNGTLALTWTGTSASANGAAPYSTSVKIYNGVLSIRVAPSTTASPAAFYLAVYTSGDGRTSWVETWQVGPSASPLNLSQVRSAVPNTTTAPTSATLGIGQVTGLSSYLNAISNSLNTVTSTVGSFNTTLGSLSNTVSDLQTTVTTLASNAQSGANSATFVDGEVPQGTVNGSNATFALANIPSPVSSLLLSRNGILLSSSSDFAISGSTVTFFGNALPQTGDSLLASYRLGTSGQASFTDAERPLGTINGSNLTFSLAAAPSTPSNLRLYKNGFLLVIGVDYNLSGANITFLNLTSTPSLGDTLLAYYRR